MNICTLRLIRLQRFISSVGKRGVEIGSRWTRQIFPNLASSPFLLFCEPAFPRSGIRVSEGPFCFLILAIFFLHVFILNFLPSFKSPLRFQKNHFSKPQKRNPNLHLISPFSLSYPIIIINFISFSISFSISNLFSFTLYSQNLNPNLGKKW